MPSQRVAVVTGSNKGIGLAIVRGLCKSFNGTVYLTSRQKDLGISAVKGLESEGLKPKFHLLDVTSQESIDALKEYMVKNYGGVDIFIHNAAIAYKAADDTPFAEQARVTINTNFTSMVNLSNAFLPIMRAEGRFITLSSFVAMMTLQKCSNEIQAFFKSPDLSEEQVIAKMKDFVESAQLGEHEAKGFANTAYGMSKLGVTALTRVLGKRARQMDQANVLVNCACPGYVKTDMSSHKGHRTPDEGAETALHLALLPKGSKEPNGEHYSEKKCQLKWYNE